jgi:RNA polymerase sigma factor (sigma-70 family)
LNTQHAERTSRSGRSSSGDATETSLVPTSPFSRSPRDFGHSSDSVGDLVRKAQKGDERAWSEVVRRFGPMVLRTARRTGLNAADAADVQQATWVQLMRYGDQVRDPDRIGAWLATTARRQSQRVSMAKTRQVPSPGPHMECCSAIPAQPNDVADLVGHDQFEHALERAMGRLPANYRQVLELLVSDSLPSYEDVARATGLPIGSIGPIRLRGLQRLRRDPGLRGYARSAKPRGAMDHLVPAEGAA